MSLPKAGRHGVPQGGDLHHQKAREVLRAQLLEVLLEDLHLVEPRRQALVRVPRLFEGLRILETRSKASKIAPRAQLRLC